MKLDKVRELIAVNVAVERERCAQRAEACGKSIEMSGSAFVGQFIADDIRSSPPPETKVIRPETAAKHPDMVTPYTIIAGASYEGLE